VSGSAAPAPACGWGPCPPPLRPRANSRSAPAPARSGRGRTPLRAPTAAPTRRAAGAPAQRPEPRRGRPCCLTTPAVGRPRAGRAPGVQRLERGTRSALAARSLETRARRRACGGPAPTPSPAHGRIALPRLLQVRVKLGGGTSRGRERGRVGRARRGPAPLLGRQPVRRVERRVRGAAARLPRGYFCARNQSAQRLEARCGGVNPGRIRRPESFGERSAAGRGGGQDRAGTWLGRCRGWRSAGPPHAAAAMRGRLPARPGGRAR